MYSNSKVLGSRNLLKNLAIYVVKYGVMLPRVGHGEDVALSCVKVHTPLLTPYCQVKTCKPGLAGGLLMLPLAKLPVPLAYEKYRLISAAYGYI